MKKAVAVIALLLSFSFPLADRAYAMAQISLQNNTKFWLNLYIDGNFGCGPVMPSGFCISSVKPGSHLLEAKRGEEVVSYESGVNIGDGTSPTWTVTIEDPDQALIKKLDGARYINRSANEDFSDEGELVINGTTLVWRHIYLWARPEVAQAIASGTHHYVQGTVGTWQTFDRMQIVGREAQHHQKSSGDVMDTTFIISEDGNSINLSPIKGGTYTFYRQ